jgi:hypothetical protein
MQSASRLGCNAHSSATADTAARGKDRSLDRLQSGLGRLDLTRRAGKVQLTRQLSAEEQELGVLVSGRLALRANRLYAVAGFVAISSRRLLSNIVHGCCCREERCQLV